LPAHAGNSGLVAARCPAVRAGQTAMGERLHAAIGENLTLPRHCAV